MDKLIAALVLLIKAYIVYISVVLGVVLLVFLVGAILIFKKR